MISSLCSQPSLQHALPPSSNAAAAAAANAAPVDTSCNLSGEPLSGLPVSPRLPAKPAAKPTAQGRTALSQPEPQHSQPTSPLAPEIILRPGQALSRPEVQPAQQQLGRCTFPVENAASRQHPTADLPDHLQHHQQDKSAGGSGATQEAAGEETNAVVSAGMVHVELSLPDLLAVNVKYTTAAVACDRSMIIESKWQRQLSAMCK